MTVTEAIQFRRTIFQFKPDFVAKDVIERVLSFGIWAPNHHLTEPWRFTVVGEQTKLELAKRYQEIQMEKAAAHVDQENREKIGAAGFKKLMGKPTIVAVSCVQEGDEQRRREDYAATCCAMLNIQLAAWEEGVGMQWSTGTLTHEEATYRRLRIDPKKEYIVGFLYVGYPAEVPSPKRKSLSEVTRWTA